MNIVQQALNYVKNTKGCATLSHFLEDHEPAGELLWLELRKNDYVREDQDCRIHLTDAGTEHLKSL